MMESDNIIYNNSREIEVTTQTRKRGRPRGSTTKEAGQTTSVHVPERVREWLEKNIMRLSDYVSDASKWHDRMLEQADDIRLADKDIARLEEERNALRKEIARLKDENLDLFRTKTRTMERLKTGDISLK